MTAQKHTSRDEQALVDALKLHAQRGPRPEFPYDDLAFTLEEAAETICQMANEREAERDEVGKLDRALRHKDEAMEVLFQRLRDARVDCSDLIS